MKKICTSQPELSGGSDSTRLQRFALEANSTADDQRLAAGVVPFHHYVATLVVQLLHDVPAAVVLVGEGTVSHPPPDHKSSAPLPSEKRPALLVQHSRDVPPLREAGQQLVLEVLAAPVLHLGVGSACARVAVGRRVLS